MEVYPNYIKKSLIYHLNHTEDLLLISRERDYSIDMGRGKIKIAPFFIVSNLWEGYYGNRDFIFFCPFKLVLRSALLRMITSYYISGKLGMKELVIFPRLTGLEKNFYNLKKISSDKIWKDILRLTLANNFSFNKTKHIFNEGSEMFAVNLIMKFIERYEKYVFSSDGKKLETTLKDKKYLYLMNSYRYSQAIRHIWKKLNSPRMSAQKITDIKTMLKPFIPQIIEFFESKNIDSRSIKILRRNVSRYLKISRTS